MEARQGRYEELQGQLLSSAQQLATRSAQLQGAIDTVLVYERRSEAVLGYLMGRWEACQRMSPCKGGGSGLRGTGMVLVHERRSEAVLGHLMGRWEGRGGVMGGVGRWEGAGWGPSRCQGAGGRVRGTDTGVVYERRSEAVLG